MLCRLIFLIGVLISSLYSVAQDPIFSQFYNAPNQINPAFTGNTNGPFIATNYRLQWPGFSSVYNTYMLSVDQFYKRLNSGFGGSILVDDAGDGTLKTIKLSGLYSYRIYVNQHTYVKLGMELGIVQSRLDPDKLIFFDQLDPQFGSVSPGGTTYPTQENLDGVGTRYYPDVSAGILIYSKRFYAGLGLKHLNNPDSGFLNNIENIDRGIPIRFTIHAGMEISLERNTDGSSGVFVAPNILYAHQGAFRQLNVGTYIDFGDFFTGLWYRHSGTNGDAIIGSMGIRSDIFKISYSYDLTVSGLGIGSGGSHELGLIFNLESLGPTESRYNDCLNMFR